MEENRTHSASLFDGPGTEVFLSEKYYKENYESTKRDRTSVLRSSSSTILSQLLHSHGSS